MITREESLRALAGEPFDVLVVGGGIVGAGVARDAAMRGYRTALIEQNDFAGGTSGRSSRLLHGGLRYLAQGRIGLVREASTEKGVLHRIAPHLAQPMPFVFPTYQGNRDWVLWQLKVGVKIYDGLCAGKNLGASSWLDRGRTLEVVPGLEPAGLKGAVRYFDGFTNDARLAIDTLRSSAHAGAVVVNYCRFTGAGRGCRWNCALEDRLRPRSFQVHARVVVNATGPWAEGLPHSRVKLRLTKGIHLVIDRSRLPLPETVVMAEGKRILFAIPWGERMILGTTDTDYAGCVDDVGTGEGDVTEVLAVANRLFPQARLAPGHVMSTWAGLRPLIANSNGKPSDLSRAHEIVNPEPGWWDVAGGKLTTYRLMAEQTLDRIIAAGQLPPATRECRTAAEPLVRAEGEASMQVEPAAPEGNPLLFARPPVPAPCGFSGILPPALTRAAVEHFCTKEWAIHLDDVMVRRAGWHYYRSDRQAAAAQVAEWMAEIRGWTPADRERELGGLMPL